MKQHVTKVAAICYYHLCRLRQIRRHVGSEIATQLVLALVISRLDYCNAALAGLPQTTIAPLQWVQNAAARLIFELGPREHITPCLLQLHWLPVRWRIQFKLYCIMHSVFNGNCPSYLTDIVQTVSASRPRLRLRSSSTQCPKTKIFLYADDAKVYNVVTCDEDQKSLQRVVDKVKE